MVKKDSTVVSVELASLPTTSKLSIKNSVVNPASASTPVDKGPPKIWRQCPFRNPARSDGLVLKHWRQLTRAVEPRQVKANDPLELREKYAATLDSNLTSTLPRVDEELNVSDSYPFAKIAPSIKVYRYSDDFYRYHISDMDPSWSKEETDLLFDLCEMFELRFVAIHDRFKWRKDITIEKLKQRYYSVTRRIIEYGFEERMKAEMSKNNNPTHPAIVALRDEASRHPLLKFTYNMEHDRERREMLERSYRVTDEQKAEEERLLEAIKDAEALVKKEERKKLELRKFKKKFGIVEDIIMVPNMDNLNTKEVWLASEIITTYKAQLSQKHNDAVDEMLTALNVPTPVISSRATNELYCVVRGDAAIMINMVNKVDSLKKELDYWKTTVGPINDHMITPKLKDKMAYREVGETVFQTPRTMMPGVMMPQQMPVAPQQMSTEEPVQATQESHGNEGSGMDNDLANASYYQQHMTRQRMMMANQQTMPQQQSPHQQSPQQQPPMQHPPQSPQGQMQNAQQQGHMQGPVAHQGGQQAPQQGRQVVQPMYAMKPPSSGTSSPHVYPQQSHYTPMAQQHMGQQSPMSKQPAMPQMPQHGMNPQMINQQRMMQQRMMQYPQYPQQQYQQMRMRMPAQGMYYPNQMYQQTPYGQLMQPGMPMQPMAMHQMGPNGHMPNQQAMNGQPQMQGTMKSPIPDHMGNQMTNPNMGAQMQGQHGNGQSQQMGSHQGRSM
ncbi:DNA methyltransferase 1-associated family protein [Babesia bovis T2Bo]|uniref:dAMP1 SANT/Myb-like domain-containing protein n=1 Tax=Babesia bovis TaxID=5865 RepID=A7ASG8_BABBO|nr:DNA methyltransferase 1-associated family protein [Babesia bovis T2Bo]EDO07487.1 DNA methyltransferase 1-associated family protein [Babesia bovis T2Bo]|eukprot:XP_001611055.1 hypothetical protein [Babesia bovis T2Bo]